MQYIYFNSIDGNIYEYPILQETEYGYIYKDKFDIRFVPKPISDSKYFGLTKSEAIEKEIKAFDKEVKRRAEFLEEGINKAMDLRNQLKQLKGEK